MNAEQSMVKEFHCKHEHIVNSDPQVCSETELFLRARLVSEEAAEFVCAAQTLDLIGMTDALGDLLYVTYGAALSLGIDMEPVFKEIHRSNMSKGKHSMKGKIPKGQEFFLPDIQEQLEMQGATFS